MRDDLPEEMRMLVDEIAKRGSQERALDFVYGVLGEKYRGYRILTFLRLDRWFVSDLAMLWGIKGFLHCHQMNYLLRVLLIASGQFTPEAITVKWTQVWFVSPHQYLVVTLENGEKIEVDLWGKTYGVPFGSHAHGFQSGSFFAKIAK